MESWGRMPNQCVLITVWDRLQSDQHCGTCREPNCGLAAECVTINASSPHKLLDTDEKEGEK